MRVECIAWPGENDDTRCVARQTGHVFPMPLPCLVPGAIKVCAYGALLVPVVCTENDMAPPVSMTT